MALLPSSVQQVGIDNCHKIYVERDYSLGLEVRFQRNFPALLEGLVSYCSKNSSIFDLRLSKKIGITQ